MVEVMDGLGSLSKNVCC